VCRRLIPSLIVVFAVLGIDAAGGLAAEPTIEVTGSSLATYAWTPSTAEVDGGGSVTFKNPTANPHALAWQSGPETPSCTGTPSLGQGNWSGSCSFNQGGTYAFYCPVHPSVMKGTITVNGPAAPVVATGAATAVGEFEATLNGTVNPSKQAATFYFEYGTTTSYGKKTTETPAGEGTTAVSESATVGELTPSTTYHFRIVAKNATGTSHGIDRTFKTTGPIEEPPAPVEPPAVEPPPASPGSPVPAVVGPLPAPVPAPPDTKITVKPAAKTKDRTPTIKFKATVAGATYRCSIDGKPFKACRSPFTTPALKPGRHTIRITAVAAGAVDPTPAVVSFKILAAKKR
jgi:plastocyanin